jgi:hypothetical protein
VANPSSRRRVAADGALRSCAVREPRRRRFLKLLIRVLPLALLATLTSPSSVSAVEVIAPFNTVTLVANPRPWSIAGLPNTINGSTAGGSFARIFTGQSAATGVVIDYGFATPEFQVTAVQLFNNGGNQLSDFDGIGTALVEVFDPASNLLFSGPLTAGNGSAGFRTNFPTPLDNVARVRLSNITNLAAPNYAPDILWREFRALQNVATPRITTALSSDGYSDNVTITGTDGLDGTLTWTLYGPVGAGASGTCSTATWAGAPVFDTGTVPITGDGVVLTTPTTPTANGCYSYGDVLSSPSYTASATSAVGQAAETFAWPVTPTISTAINADGYSDDITIRGTNGFGGTLTWSLLGPVNAGPGGTCGDADYSGAPTNAAGTVTVVGDVTVTVTPPADPTAPGCYTYEVTLTGPNIGQPVTSPRGEPAEILTRASSPSIRTEIDPDGFSDDIIVSDTSGFAGDAAWILSGPVTAGPSGTCSDAVWAGAPVFTAGTTPIPGDGTSTVTPTTPGSEGCYSYGVVLSGPNYTADAVSAVGLVSETFAMPPAPTTTTTTTTTTVPPTTTDPCATTTTTTTTTSRTTPESSTPESSTPESSTPESVTGQASTTTSSTTTSSPSTTTSSTTTSSPSTSIAAPAFASPAGFSRAPAQVPDPCPPTTTSTTTTVAPTTVAPPTPAVTAGGGAAAGSGGSSGGALPVTGPQPVGPLAVTAILLVLAGAVLVLAARPRR